MIHGKTCYNCGGNLKYDNVKKILICPFCGKTQLLDDSGEPATIEGARKAMKEGLFLKARNMLAEIKTNNKNKGIADDPKLSILIMLCGYQSAAFAEYLKENQKSPSAMKNVLSRPEFSRLLERKDLPEEKRQYISDILEFCMTAIEVSRDSTKIAGNQEKIKTNNRRMSFAGNRKRTSAFAKMDEEERRQNDRRQRLWEARNPEKVAETYYDLSEDTAYRIFKMLTADNKNEYEKAMKARAEVLREREETRQYYKDIELQEKARNEAKSMNHTKEYLEKKIAAIREDLGKAQAHLDELLVQISKNEEDL